MPEAWKHEPMRPEEFSGVSDMEIGETIGSASVQASKDLLEVFPHPVVWIGPDYDVRWINAAGRSAYSTSSGTCYQLTHGYGDPCIHHGEACPKNLCETLRSPVSVGHVHRTGSSYDFYSITAIPIEHGGILEIQVPVDEVMVRDSLTHVFSRHLLEQVAARELALLERMNAPYALMMVDIDHLKSVNDGHGHQAGDAALRAVGQEILGSIRAADCPGRLGGDEFCVFLPRTDSESARILAERILAAIRRIRLPDALSALRLTASIGVYSTRENFNLTAAVASADRQLYRAKITGRDRVVSS